jgi:hypothetical protein
VGGPAEQEGPRLVHKLVRQVEGHDLHEHGGILLLNACRAGRAVVWLHGTRDARWANAHQHPKVGPVSCKLPLTNWVAHDLYHLRQLINLRCA